MSIYLSPQDQVDLNMVVDEIYQKAHNKKMKYRDIAEAAGLSIKTIRRLGERKTKLPQFRTVERLARAFGGQLLFSQRKRKKIKVKWNKKSFRIRGVA